MITDQQFCLDEIYENFNLIFKVLKDEEIQLGFKPGGAGNIYLNDGESICGWTSLENGVQQTKDTLRLFRDIM